jgi:hypothetical protein
MSLGGFWSYEVQDSAREDRGACDMVRQTCQGMDVVIVRGSGVSPGHIHLNPGGGSLRGPEVVK